MDVRVEAGPLSAGAVAVDSKITVVALSGVVITAPVISRFSLTPVISVGGTSISAVPANKVLIGVMAA
jgi:hypothetical protein